MAKKTQGRGVETYEEQRDYKKMQTTTGLLIMLMVVSNCCGHRPVALPLLLYPALFLGFLFSFQGPKKPV